MTVSQVGTVSVYVRDQQVALDFYVDALGFEKRADHDMGPLGRWLEVAPPGAETALMLGAAEPFERTEEVGRTPGLVFIVDDVHATHAELRAKDVPVTDPETQAWGTTCKVTDPDGLTILLKQPRS